MCFLLKEEVRAGHFEEHAYSPLGYTYIKPDTFDFFFHFKGVMNWLFKLSEVNV